MFLSYPATPERLSPAPSPFLTLTRREIGARLWLALLLLPLAGGLLYLTRQAPESFRGLPTLTADLAAVALGQWALLRLWESGRWWKIMPADSTLLAGRSRAHILSVGLNALLLLVFVALLVQRSLASPLSGGLKLLILLLALVLARGALGELAECRRDWPRPAAIPLAAPLPPRAPPGHSYRQNLTARLDFPLWLLLGGLLLVLIMALLFQPPTAQQMSGLMELGGLVATLVAAGLARRVWQRRRCGYEAQSDSFHRDRASYFGPYEREGCWPAADFCGLYWEKKTSWSREVPRSRLWLAGKAGGQDVLLAELNYWHRDNQRAARQLAQELSAASGLPLLYRWPGPPAEIHAQALELPADAPAEGLFLVPSALFTANADPRQLLRDLLG